MLHKTPTGDKNCTSVNSPLTNAKYFLHAVPLFAILPLDERNFALIRQTSGADREILLISPELEEIHNAITANTRDALAQIAATQLQGKIKNEKRPAKSRSAKPRSSKRKSAGLSLDLDLGELDLDTINFEI